MIALLLATITFHELIKRDRLVKPMITVRKSVNAAKTRDALGGGWMTLTIAGLVAATTSAARPGLVGVKR